MGRDGRSSLNNVSLLSEKEDSILDKNTCKGFMTKFYIMNVVPCPPDPTVKT